MVLKGMNLLYLYPHGIRESSTWFTYIYSFITSFNINDHLVVDIIPWSSEGVTEWQTPCNNIVVNIVHSVG